MSPEDPFRLYDSMCVRNVTVTRTPRIEQDTLSFRMQLTFDTLLSNYFSYYEDGDDSLFIRFYDAVIEPAQERFPGSSPFRGLRTVTKETRKALSGTFGVIAIRIDGVWRYTISASPPVMEIVLWRIIDE